MNVASRLSIHLPGEVRKGVAMLRTHCVIYVSQSISVGGGQKEEKTAAEVGNRKELCFVSLN